MATCDERILVAGGSQGVGRLVAVRALQLGASVRVFSRRPERAGLPQAESLAGDALDPAVCKEAVACCTQVVCALGLLYAEGRVLESTDRIVDGEGVIHLLRAAEAEGIRRFVLVSSLGAGASWSWLPGPVKRAFERAGAVPVLEAKGRSERALAESTLDWTILRPGYLHDHRMRTAPVCVEGPAPGVTSRGATADVAVRALTSPASSRRTLTVVDGLVAALAVVPLWSRPVRFETRWQPWR